MEHSRYDAAGLATKSIEEIGGYAEAATDVEHELSFRDAMKLYPTAAGWSIFFSLAVVMCAFDSQLLGDFYATPAFQIRQEKMAEAERYLRRLA